MRKPPRSSAMAALWSARDGIAAVEFALVAPVLVLLLTGAVSFGVGLRMKMEVGNAARAGAASASYPIDRARITAAAQSATTLSNVTVTPPIEERNSCVDPVSGVISSAGSATKCPGTDSPPGTYVTVRTQKSYSYILPLPGMAAETILSGKAVARTQ